MLDGTADWCNRKTDVSFPKWHEEFGKFPLKNFILGNKMVELNQNKNWKQLHWPDAVRKLYFTLEINEKHN